MLQWHCNIPCPSSTFSWLNSWLVRQRDDGPIRPQLLETIINYVKYWERVTTRREKHTLRVQTLYLRLCIIIIPYGKKKEIWLSPMKKSLYQQFENQWTTQNATKNLITQRQWTDLGRSVGVTTVMEIISKYNRERTLGCSNWKVIISRQVNK